MCVFVSETGKNPNADLPHSRDNCVVFPQVKPWNSNTNKRYCDHCFCFVCDIPASKCMTWKCHFSAYFDRDMKKKVDGKWIKLRAQVRKRLNTSKKESKTDDDQATAHPSVLATDKDSSTELSGSNHLGTSLSANSDVAIVAQPSSTLRTRATPARLCTGRTQSLMTKILSSLNPQIDENSRHGLKKYSSAVSSLPPRSMTATACGLPLSCPVIPMNGPSPSLPGQSNLHSQLPYYYQVPYGGATAFSQPPAPTYLPPPNMVTPHMHPAFSDSPQFTNLRPGTRSESSFSNQATVPCFNPEIPSQGMGGGMYQQSTEHMQNFGGGYCGGVYQQGLPQLAISNSGYGRSIYQQGIPFIQTPNGENGSGVYQQRMSNMPPAHFPGIHMPNSHSHAPPSQQQLPQRSPNDTFLQPHNTVHGNDRNQIGWPQNGCQRF